MATDGSDPKPCNPKIYAKGEHIATLYGASNAVEQWVKKVAAQAKAKVDWHYAGGRAVVKFLGNAKARTRVFEAIKALEGELEGRILRSFGPTDPPPTSSFIPNEVFTRQHS